MVQAQNEEINKILKIIVEKGRRKKEIDKISVSKEKKNNDFDDLNEVRKGK